MTFQDWFTLVSRSGFGSAQDYKCFIFPYLVRTCGFHMDEFHASFAVFFFAVLSWKMKWSRSKAK